MSNISTFLITLVVAIFCVVIFCFLIKKWTNFHLFRFGKVLKLFYALVLLLIISIFFLVAYSSLTNYWEDDRVIVANEFQGVQLGWTKDELYFRKGEPTNTNELEDKIQRLDYGATAIRINNGQVDRIMFLCDLDKNNLSVKAGGVRCEDSIQRVIKLYGDSKIISISDDKLRRIYNYPQYNLAFLLSKSTVDVLMVFDNKTDPNGISFLPSVEQPKNLEVDGKSGKVVPSDDLPKELIAEPSNLILLDHCAPNLKKAERLRRLALKGVVRETGYQTYSTGNFEIIFSDSTVISCK